MPTTPGQSSLSGVTQEADEINHNLGEYTTVETLYRPSAERVLRALPGYAIAHFACHGVSKINPADSHLILLKERKGVEFTHPLIKLVDNHGLQDTAGSHLAELVLPLKELTEEVDEL